MTIGSLVKVLTARVRFQYHYGRIERITSFGNLEIRLLQPDNVTLVLDPHEVVEVENVFETWFSTGWLAA